MVGDSESTLGLAEVVTQGYAVAGRCRGLNEYLRLIDLLNNPEISHLQMSHVRVRQLLPSAEVIASEAPLFLDKQFVIIGRSLASPEAEARRNEAHRMDYVEKAKRRMLVFAPPFRILGNVHMIKDADFSVALPKLCASFLAMTEVRTVHEGGSGVVWDDEFIVVNGRRIEMIGLVAEDWSDPAGATGTAEPEASAD